MPEKKRKIPRIWLEPPVYIILSPFISSHDHLVMSILMFCAIYAYFFATSYTIGCDIWYHK